MSDIDLLILVVHSSNSNLSPPHDEETRDEEAKVKRTARMEGVVNGMMREVEQCHPVVRGKAPRSSPTGSSAALLFSALSANQILQ